MDYYGPEMANAFAAMTGYYIFSMIIGLVLLVAMWKIFTKAGEPGWAAIIPIYNIVVMLKIINRPIWWIVLMLIPLVNIVIMFIVIFDLGKSFGKSALWSFFLLLVLSVIGYLILGFGKDQYTRIERSA